ncbi:DUF4157 domain-containing protein [Dyella choica]|uniref:DUF4157 domain-containing protein n=1 Tax=Dyella choica TaxID=1927959 RepID=A0A3S0S2N7_9GAMM|nr:DUF4157 domain-containing protein [Dyella choica]RUL79012.1 DUF4157 domain-containing protein [Dyella choica]
MSKLAAPVRQTMANSTPASFADSHATSPLQRRVDASSRQVAQQRQLAQLRADRSAEHKPNGLPSPLRAGIEAASGMDMGDVVVHRNSAKPAQLNALAYAQGNEIHLGAGQEKHLPHEAWHVVQQRQGRVKPTAQLAGVALNDNAGLEREADVMGARVLASSRSAVQRREVTAWPMACAAQLKEGGRLREVSLEQLPEADAQKHLVDSFKKGRLNNPVVNEQGAVVQQKPKKESFLGGDMFFVVKSDLNTGTGTSQGTREYVNAASTNKPDSIRFDYATGKSAKIVSQTVKGNKGAFEVENPEADFSYASGKLWDAGHKLGRQNGGLGNDNDWVFPQNPAFNQGNSKNMSDVEETRPAWRQHEDDFHDGVKTSGYGVWWIKLD